MKKIRFFLSHVTRRALPVLLMAIVTAAVFLYADGRFSLPFLEQELTTPSVIPSSPLGNEEETMPEAEQITPEDDDSHPVTLPKVREPQLAMSQADIMTIGSQMCFKPNSVPTLLEKGYTRSTEPYSYDTSVFAYAGGFDFLPDTKAYYLGKVQTLEYVRPDMQSAPVPVYSTKSEPILAVQLYMGYILIDNSSVINLYSSDGVFLFSYKTTDYSPAFTRDRSGNPLFERIERTTAGENIKTYYAVGANGFVRSDYDDEIDNRGLYYDYAPSFGISDTTLRRLVDRRTLVIVAEDGTETVEDATRWAFGYSASWRRTTYRYTAAYDFREDMAAVVDEEGKLFYIGTHGYQAFTTQRDFYYYERFMREYLLPPLTAGEESIGFYYYDHGLVRVRRQVVDWYGITYIDTLRVALDEDILVDKKGNEFPIPTGYDIIAYSDGVILLEKDGRYGYMDHTGAWIAQPIYDFARPFFEGTAVLGFEDGTRMMIDTNGDIVIPPGEFLYISDVSSGVVAVWTKDREWQILHKMARFGQ